MREEHRGMTFTPTIRGWVTLAVCGAALVAGVWTRYPSLIGFGVALLAALIAAVASVLVPVPVQISRTVSPARVARLGECTATIEVTNTAPRWSVAVSGVDRVGEDTIAFSLPRLRPGQSASTEVPIPTTRRGTIRFGPLVLYRQSFADLLRLRREYGQSATVLVEPRVLDAGGLPPGARRGHIGAEERIAHGGTDLVGLREYIPGDDLRRLHWATSARRGTLMVREDADPASPHLTVLLDDRDSSYPASSAVDRENSTGHHDDHDEESETGTAGHARTEVHSFEEAVDVAASLLAAAAAGESPARLLTVSGDLDLDIPAPSPLTGPASVDPHALARLARLDLQQSTAPVQALTGSPDVLAVVTGSGADLADLLLTATAAPAGAIISIEDAPDSLVSASAGVTILRGPRAEELARSWRTAVSR